MLKKSLILGCLGLLGLCGAAAAAPISCAVDSYDVSARVAGASACQRLAVTGANSANDDAVLVNLQGFFGIGAWQFEGKYDDMSLTGGKDVSTLFDFSGGSQAGKLSYVGGSAQPLDLMLVFKSGKGTNLVAYLLGDTTAGIGYSSPFIAGLFNVDNAKDVSHISVYTSIKAKAAITDDAEKKDPVTKDPELAAGPLHLGGKATDVPEPGTLFLLGLGVAGIVLRRRRARASALPSALP